MIKEILSGLKDWWLKNSVRFVLYSGLSILVLIVLMPLFFNYFYKPQSCMLCHEMKPAYETWNKSFHSQIENAKNDCLGCHAAPGFGNKIRAKLSGLAFLWRHLIDSYDADIKAKLPVYCVRSGCHTDPWEMDKGSKIRVNHALHISKGYACVVCHDRIAHGFDPKGLNLPDMKDFCFTCHNDEIASRNNCQFCHIYQEAMLMGKAGDVIQQGDSSVHKKLNISCVDCHTEGCDPKPVQVCLECHTDSYVLGHKSQSAKILRSVQALEDGIVRLAEAMRKSEDLGWDISQLNGIYNLVKGVYTFVKADGSMGAHNMGYCQSLLNKAMDRLDFAYLLIDQKKKRRL